MKSHYVFILIVVTLHITPCIAQSIDSVRVTTINIIDESEQLILQNEEFYKTRDINFENFKKKTRIQNIETEFHSKNVLLCYEIVSALKNGYISEKQAIEYINNLSGRDKTHTFPRILYWQFKNERNELLQYKALLSELELIINTKQEFDSIFEAEIRMIEFLKYTNLEEFDKRLKLFWDTNKFNINYLEWLSFRNILEGKQTLQTRSIIEEIMNCNNSWSICERIGIYDFFNFWTYFDDYSPNNIFEILKDSTYINKNLIIDYEKINKHLEVLKIVDSGFLYDFNINTPDLSSFKYITSNEITLEFGYSKVYNSLVSLGLGFYLDNYIGLKPNLQTFEHIVSITFDTVFNTMGIPLDFISSYSFGKEDQSKIEYKLHAYSNGISYSIVIDGENKTMNTDILVAFFNEVLRDHKSKYRFYKLNSDTNVLLISDDNIKELASLIIFYIY